MLIIFKRLLDFGVSVHHKRVATDEPRLAAWPHVITGSYHRDEMMPLVSMTAHRYSPGMIESQTSLKFKLAAIDLDGTLLGRFSLFSRTALCVRATTQRLRRVLASISLNDLSNCKSD
jgi:hypothetical protein